MDNVNNIGISRKPWTTSNHISKAARLSFVCVIIDTPIVPSQWVLKEYPLKEVNYINLMFIQIFLNILEYTTTIDPIIRCG